MSRLILCVLLTVTLLPPGVSARGDRARSPAPSVDLPQRQGGDHPEDAVPIVSLPFFDVGGTTGMDDDFYYSCPYGNSGVAPDVFYVYEPAHSVIVTIDLCGSHYDTCVYLVDAANWDVIACNDDYYLEEPCGVYVSRIDAAFLPAGGRYWIIVDGYPTCSGDYVLAVICDAIPNEATSWGQLKILYK